VLKVVESVDCLFDSVIVKAAGADADADADELIENLRFLRDSASYTCVLS
jgi:hypothetical protein